MNPRRMIGLYPIAWRHRYGDEFAALLEKRPPRLPDLLDIAWGAIDAHLFPQAPEGRYRMFTRLSGVAGIGAGLALVLVVLFALPVVPAFYALALVGMAGIHLRHLRARPSVAWFGFAAGLIGFGTGIGSMVLTAFGALPPNGAELGFLSGIALWVGSIALGASMLGTAVFPMLAAMAFTTGAPLAMVGLLVARAAASAAALDAIARVGIVVYALGWVGVGLSLLAAQPREGVLGSAH